MTNILSIEYDIVKGFFLFIIVCSGQFVADLLDCQVKTAIKNSILSKHALALLSIFLSLHFPQDAFLRPGEKIFYSVAIWLTFLICTRIAFNFSASALMLIFLYFVLQSYIHTQSRNRKRLEHYQALKRTTHIILALFFSVIFIGLGKAIYTHNKESKTFHLFEFLFGSVHCNNTTLV